ncbi:MAG: hypothetical protein HWE08_12150, partial [Alphaproteobacteria bacterium]|nr:hypothetical protein [Alphaproteobacteria bacterium]
MFDALTLRPLIAAKRCLTPIAVATVILMAMPAFAQTVPPLAQEAEPVNNGTSETIVHKRAFGEWI